MCFHYSHLGAELFSSQDADILQRNTIKYVLSVLIYPWFLFQVSVVLPT